MNVTSILEDDITFNSTDAQGVTLISDPTILSRRNAAIYKSIYIPSMVYCCIMFTVGAPGNALVFYVYINWRKSTSRLFILALAAFDLVNCFITVPTELYFIVNIIQHDTPVWCKISRFLTFSMNNMSSFVLLGIAIDRFLRIYKPLVPPMRNKHAEIIIGVSSVVGFATACPALVLYGSSTVKIPLSKNATVVGKTCLIDDKFVNSVYPIVFNSVLTAGTIIIDIIMCCAYIYIGTQAIKAIRSTQHYFPTFACSRNDSIDFSVELSLDESKCHDSVQLSFKSKKLSTEKKEGCNGSVKSFINGKHSNARKTSGATLKSEKILSFKRNRSLSSQVGEQGRRQMFKSTFMLFLVTLLFIISFIPYCTVVFLRYTRHSYYSSLSNSGKAMYNLFLRSYMLSSSLNPVIYSFLSDKFRSQCKILLKKLICRREN